MPPLELEVFHDKYKIFLKIFQYATSLNFLPVSRLRFFNTWKIAIIPFSLILSISLSIYKVSTIQDNFDVVDLLYSIVVTCCMGQALSKFLIFAFFMGKKFSTVLVYLEDLVFAQSTVMSHLRQRVLSKSIKTGYKIVMIYFALCVVSFLAYLFYVLHEKKFTSIMFYTFPSVNKGSILHIPLNLIYQFLIFSYGIWYMVLTDMLFVFISMYFRGELASLSELIGGLDDERIDSEKEHRRILHTFYEFHTKTKEMQRTFIDVCWYSYLVQFFTSTVYLCLMLYMMSFSAASFTLYFIPLAAMNQMFMVCLIGEILHTSGEDVINAFSATKWYLMTTRNQRIFLILLTFVQPPTIIKTFGFKEVTLHTFLQLVKAMGSYCAFLYTILH
uniref:Odorant receptor n=1 Tax=Lutzomyia longipalpis TaxID=7200 RepID=A0A240SY02_LUTLO